MLRDEYLIKYRLLILIIFSTIINLAWILIVRTRPYSDFIYYHQLAVEISNGGRWGDTYTTAGYSAVLGLVYKIFGSKVMIAKILNVFCSMISNILLCLIFKKCNIASKYIFSTVLIFFLYPFNIMYNSILANEIIFTLIVLLILYIYLSEAKGKYIFEGALIASASMIKPFFIVFGLCIFTVDMMVNKKSDFRKILFNNVNCTVVALLCIAPWVIRNTYLIGQFTFISNNGGIVLYINNNSDNITGKWIPSENITNSITNTQNYIKSNATEKNKILKKTTKQWILTHPKKFIDLGFKRVINTFYKVDDLDYVFNGIKISNKLQYYLVNILKKIKNIMSNSLIIFLVINAVSFAQNKRMQNCLVFKLNTFILIFTLYFSCIYFIAEGQGRYSFPLNFACAYSLSFFIHCFFAAIKKSFHNYKQLIKLYRTS